MTKAKTPVAHTSLPSSC